MLNNSLAASNPKDRSLNNSLAASNIKDCVLKSDPATSFPLSTSKRSFGFHDILC